MVCVFFAVVRYTASLATISGTRYAVTLQHPFFAFSLHRVSTHPPALSSTHPPTHPIAPAPTLTFPHPRPSESPFRCCSPLMSMSEEDILAYAGFDAAIFLRFYSLAFKVIHLSMYLVSIYVYLVINAWVDGNPWWPGAGGG